MTKLADGAFTDAAHNAVLVGGPGTGKTHLATAVGVQAIARHGKRVRFYSTVDLVNALEHGKHPANTCLTPLPQLWSTFFGGKLEVPFGRRMPSRCKSGSRL